MARFSHWLKLILFVASLGICSSAWSQASNYQTTASKARTISDSQLPAFQNAPSFNGQAINILRSMYSNTGSGGSSAGGRSAASIAGQFGGAGLSRSKPFSSYNPQPTVSPYLNLFRVDLNGNSDFNYSTLVRPQLQQQQLNQQLELQNLQNARRMQAIAAQANFNPQGSKDQYPTGHQTVFNYMGHYYPTPRPNLKRAVQQ